MVWRPKPAGPRNTRELFHWLWEQFKRVGDQIGGDTETPPTTPPDPPTVPSPGPGSHSHYIENLINVADSPVGLTRQVFAFDGLTTNLYSPEYRLNWRTPYTPGDTYYTHDVVFDSGWTMVANKTTTARAAPQPVGPPIWSFETTPTWATNSNISVVYTGHLYTFTESGWFQQLRVWVPTLTSDTNYRFVIIRNPFGPAPKLVIIEEPVLSENAWTTLAAGSELVLAGEQVLVYIDALNSGSSTPTIGGWNYAGTTNLDADPGSQAWNTNVQETILRINETDLNTDNRETELLGMVTGTVIRFSDSLDPTTFKEFRTNADPIDRGTWIEFPNVTLVNQQGSLGLVATDMDASTPIAQATDYVDAPTWWSLNPVPWATVEGFKQYDGVDQPGQTDTAFGVDLLFQPGSLSDDWDVFAVSDGVGGADGGIAGARTVNQIVIDSDFTIPTSLAPRTVVCNNTSPITVTMPDLFSSTGITIIRQNTGEVTIDGNGATVQGLATQNIPMRGDAADLISTQFGWVLT